MRVAFITVLAAGALFGVTVSGCNNQAEVLPAAVHHSPPPERRISRGRQQPRDSGRLQQIQQMQRMRVLVRAGDLAQYEPLPEPVPLAPPEVLTPALAIARARLGQSSALFLAAPIPELDIRYPRARSGSGKSAFSDDLNI